MNKILTLQVLVISAFVLGCRTARDADRELLYRFEVFAMSAESRYRAAENPEFAKGVILTLLESGYCIDHTPKASQPENAFRIVNNGRLARICLALGDTDGAQAYTAQALLELSEVRNHLPPEWQNIKTKADFFALLQKIDGIPAFEKRNIPNRSSGATR